MLTVVIAINGINCSEIALSAKKSLTVCHSNRQRL